jgi:hypothetical protein
MVASKKTAKGKGAADVKTAKAEGAADVETAVAVSTAAFKHGGSAYGARFVKKGFGFTVVHCEWPGSQAMRMQVIRPCLSLAMRYARPAESTIPTRVPRSSLWSVMRLSLRSATATRQWIPAPMSGPKMYRSPSGIRRVRPSGSRLRAQPRLFRTGKPESGGASNSCARALSSVTMADLLRSSIVQPKGCAQPYPRSLVRSDPREL